MASGNWMTQEQPGQWRASKLEGVDVYNAADEKLGDISELIIDNSGKIQAVVVGVGGFLGLGERDVAIPFDQVKFVMEPRVVATTATTAPGATVAVPANPNAPATVNPNAPATTGTVVTTDRTAAAAVTRRAYPDHALVNLTKDQVRAAPEFKYAR